MGGAPARAAPARSRALLVVPVLLCLVILWQTRQLYGSCTAPSSIGSLEALQSYLQDTSRTLRKRNATQADALQQLAASLAESGPRAAALQSELNETRGFLHGSKEKILEHMVEITSLKEKAGSQEQRIQQKHNEAEQARNEAKSAKEEAEKLRQQLKEKEEQLQKQQASQPAQQQQQGPAAGPPLTEAAALSRLHILETAGMQCNPVKDQEFWADPLIWGYEHRAADAAECCASCHAYNTAAERGGTPQGRNASRCNTWAYCADKELCKGRWGECWVKNQKAALPPPPALPPDAHAVKGWISGVVYPDEVLFPTDNSSHLVLHTTLGDIEIQLLPSLAPGSVRELKRAARMQANSLSKCSNCRIYRPEPNFLVQGQLEAPGSYVAVPRHPNPQQPMVMPRGMVCWAGGTGGPHWFVNLVDQSGFKDEHLCWGQVKDMTLFDKIITLPRKEKKPGKMEELVEHIRYNISLKVT